MKIAIRVLIGVFLLVVIGFGVLAIMNRPISKEAVNEKIEKHLTKVLKKNDSLSSVLLTIHSGQTGYSEQFAVGTKNHASDQPVQVDSPYHSASIGKTMNAVVYGMLVDEGTVRYDDKINTWLGDDILKGLFAIDGIDYSDQVTVRHLLSHTSGVGDYFEGPVRSGKPILEMIRSNPDLSFTPIDLIAFTRENQEPVGRPGQQFYYSDTGYILLGLILETIEGKPYSAILEETIFEPLGMDDSYLMFYNDEPADIVGIYLDDIDLSEKDALSVDWAGGGVGATGTYVLYDKEKDTFFIANFGSLDFAQKGIEELVKIRMIYDRMIVE
ncbi:serine hydrolase domain-containing protein [Paenibacillus sp. MCAF20]